MEFEIDDLRRIAVISPHLDDAVFGCGDLLALRPGATVITVFAGGPSPPFEMKPWDLAAGFAPGDDVIAARRGEDAAALSILGAAPFWLDFWDSQYGRTPAVAEIASAIRTALRAVEPDAVFFPLGLYHSDHLLTHEACLAALKHEVGGRGLALFLYEDAIYRRYPEHGPASRLRALEASGYVLEAASFGGGEASEEKRRAIACYRSQIRALGVTPGHPGPGDTLAPEGYWRLPP